MKYGIIFWGISSECKKVFALQKKIVRIMVGIKPQNSCRNLYKRLQILPPPCEYISPLLDFVISNQEHFQANPAVHSSNTRNKHHHHRPIANLTGFQKSTHYSGIKIHGGHYEKCHLLGYKTPVRTSQDTHYVSTTETSQLMLCKI
jgi:hypothetical protein